MRLATNENDFTRRVSATLLMCNVYHRAGPNKDKIRQYKFYLTKKKIHRYFKRINVNVTKNHSIKNFLFVQSL